MDSGGSAIYSIGFDRSGCGEYAGVVILDLTAVFFNRHSYNERNGRISMEEILKYGWQFKE